MTGTAENGPEVAGSGRSQPGYTPTQEVRFCRSRDGVRIAYAVHGNGPLVIATCWLSDLQFDGAGMRARTDVGTGPPDVCFDGTTGGA